MEEVGDDGLLKGLATLFPSAVGETMSTIGVDEDSAAFWTAGERRVRTDIKLRKRDWQAYTSRPTSLLLSLNFFLHALALSAPYVLMQYVALSWGWSDLMDG